MGANANNISGLSKVQYTIKAKSTQTISFMGASPNYYRITNGGIGSIYLGVSMMPTSDFFDMKIPSATTKLYVDAYGHDQIYIYNPSETEANIIVTSFYGPFDSTVLALSDMGQDFSNIEFSGEFDAKGNLLSLLQDIKKNTNDEEELVNIYNVLKGISGTINTSSGALGKSILANTDNTTNILTKIGEVLQCNQYSDEKLADVNTWLEGIKEALYIIGPDITDILAKMSNNEVAINDIQEKTLNLDYIFQCVSVIQDATSILQNIAINNGAVQAYVNHAEVKGYQSTTLTAPEGYYFSKVIAIKWDCKSNFTTKFIPLDYTPEICLNEMYGVSVESLNLSMQCKAIELINDNGELANAEVIAEIKAMG